MILVDSNYLIEIQNGNDEVLKEILIYEPKDLFNSVISEWDILQGARSQQEGKAFRKALSRYNIIELDDGISRHAGILLKAYVYSHHLSIPDALIAATAIKYNLSLKTYNRKDFRFIQGLTLL